MRYGGAVNREELTTDLARHIEETPLVDTHEHLRQESEWLDDGPDILQDLFGNYVAADRFMHAVPVNKLFAFGGDTSWPTAALAYAQQARRGIRRALAAEVAAGDLTERQAMAIATRIMRANQYACFDVVGTRANIRAAANQYATPTTPMPGLTDRAVGA